ncbi:hypothetical protein QGN32_01210 [Mycolicibacterium sp. ND9-15]|uniref:hypothetical protein n=1 Tax=Mycolicibacterium sp. ND9-15 TaxID=3042320 RepID=UPI002DDAEBB9|nr:hypothetical protein [Mycolicibacterium sp. ND9-15]WSE56589.1 hypothetical protein QGN32_01210 [Mycolicibacterium sp. ND9-15]
MANYEPVAWAEEVIEAAQAVNHPQLPDLYVTASICWMAGRVDEALRYDRIGRTVLAEPRRATVRNRELARIGVRGDRPT